MSDDDKNKLAPRKHYTDEFKQQIVELCKLEVKPKAQIAREYGITESRIYEWIKRYDNSGSFKAKDNRTEEENELIRLRKENCQLQMENDILKQAALILGKHQQK